MEAVVDFRLQSSKDTNWMEHQYPAPAADLLADDPRRVHQFRRSGIHCYQAWAEAMPVDGLRIVLHLEHYHDDC
jgi:hypothetical protein